MEIQLESQPYSSLQSDALVTYVFDKDDKFDGVLGVRPEYLAAARQTIDEEFGSLNAYLRDAGITEDEVGRLRSELLA